MGACATKPEADATPPLPEKYETEKKELTVSATVIETNEVVDAGKSRSLSNLFKQSEQVKVSTENDMTQTEMVKEEACEAEENTNISETKATEVVKSEISRETSLPTVINAVVEAEKENEVEAATDKFEILVEKIVTPITDAPDLVKAKEVETANKETETLAEKTLTPIIYAPVEDEADKEKEVASATEIQETVAIEDIKIEEDDTIETTKSESVGVESASSKIEFVEEETSPPVVYAHVEADTKIEAAGNEIQIAEAVAERKIEEHDKVVETLKPESPEKIAEESMQTTEFGKPAMLTDEEIKESNIEEKKAVTENQKAPEENTTETEVCAETVKPC